MGNERIKEAIFDAGPIIHLHEIEKIDLLNLFEKIYITEEVNNEIKNIKLDNIKNIRLNKKSKDFSKGLIMRYGVDLGEATAIALAKQLNIEVFFTDDLLARDVSKQFNLEPHGSLAIITRCYKTKMISKEETIDCLRLLEEKSSLFITSDIVNDVIKKLG